MMHSRTEDSGAAVSAANRKGNVSKRFFQWLSLGIGTIVMRTWKFGFKKKNTVVLEHDCLTGRRQVC